MKKRKYAIVASRNFEDYEKFKFYLEKYFRNINYIISGEAKGIDTYAKRYVKNNNIEYETYLADLNDLSEAGKIEKFIVKQNIYGKYNINSRKERNHDIVMNCDKVIAFMKGFSAGIAHDIYLLQFDKYEKLLYILNHKEKFF